MDIRGGYAKPHWTDVLWVQLFLLPITTYRWTTFYLRWLWLFGIKRQEYGEEESSGLGEETPTLVPRGGTWTITVHYLVLPSTYYAMKTQQTHRMSSPCK